MLVAGFQTDKDVHMLVLSFLLFIFRRTSCSSDYFCGRYMEAHPGVRRPGLVWSECGIGNIVVGADSDDGRWHLLGGSFVPAILVSVSNVLQCMWSTVSHYKIAFVLHINEFQMFNS